MPRQGHETDQRRLGAGRVERGEDRLQLRDDRLGIGALQREQADRLAGHPVDVEVGQRLDHVLPLGCRAAEQDRVAARIDPDVLGRGDQRLDELGRGGGGNVAQRHDRDAVAGTHLDRPAAERQDLGQADRRVRRHDTVRTWAALDQGGAVGAQHGLEHRQEIALSHRCAGRHA